MVFLIPSDSSFAFTSGANPLMLLIVVTLMDWVSPFVVMKTIISFPFFGRTQANMSASSLCEYLGMPGALYRCRLIISHQVEKRRSGTRKSSLVTFSEGIWCNLYPRN